VNARSNHPLHKRIAALREQSRWPDQEDFASQVGLSLGGYRKYETGERIPSLEVLRQIVERAGIDQGTADELLNLRNDAKAGQMGLLGSVSQTQAVDCESLAKRVRAETVYVLKQVGIDVKEPTRRVMEKRISMILKSVLGV
jgi:transcriptional regulator with XRE-family HTH domain